MRQWWTAGGPLLVVALALGACSETSGSGGSFSGGGGFSGGGAPAYGACHLYSSCATCTPVVGCGWCYLEDGTGKCAFDPDECAGTAFSWTWEPKGCHVAAEAGVNPIDAGPIVPDAQSGSGDAGQEASSAKDAAGDATGEASDATSGGSTSETGAPATDAAGEAVPGSDAASAE